MIEIEFSTKKLKKACSSDKAMRGRWGDELAKKLRRRLADLEAADSLDEMRNLPGRCHELTGDLDGSLAVDLKHPYRLIFRPNHKPTPTKDDGGLDWSQVTKILVTDVTDYH